MCLCVCVLFYYLIVLLLHCILIPLLSFPSQIYNRGRLYHFIDGYDIRSSNWMRYVNPARSLSEQNLVACQNGHDVYFYTIRPVEANQELLVWYSQEFAQRLCSQPGDELKQSEYHLWLFFPPLTCSLSSSPPFLNSHPLLFSPLIFLSMLSFNCSFHPLSNSFFSVTTMQRSSLLWHLNSMTIYQWVRGQCSKRQSGGTNTETVFFSYLEQIQMGFKSVCSIKWLKSEPFFFVWSDFHDCCLQSKQEQVSFSYWKDLKSLSDGRQWDRVWQKLFPVLFTFWSGCHCYCRGWVIYCQNTIDGCTCLNVEDTSPTHTHSFWHNTGEISKEVGKSSQQCLVKSMSHSQLYFQVWQGVHALHDE